jgi:hypothetical protein
VDKRFSPPSATQQANIHQLLLTARKVWLSDALREAMTHVDQRVLREQGANFIPVPAQRILAAAGIRDEAVFPLPVVLETKPTLIAYYRLLLGVSQKRFYNAATGMSPFFRLEEGALLTAQLQRDLPEFCAAMCEPISELVLQADSSLEVRDIEDLQLLTLGSYYYGSLNNKIGQAATQGVFAAISEIVEQYVVSQGQRELHLDLRNGRHISIIVASDPDMRIVDVSGSNLNPIVSIEIKGGADRANVYNRGGEAEKSHQGAKQRGYEVCWTIINMTNVDIEKLYQGSPTTNVWFDTNEVIARTGSDWESFKSHVRRAIGLG